MTDVGMICFLDSMKIKPILAARRTENGPCWFYSVRDRRHRGAAKSHTQRLDVWFNDSCCHRCSVRLESNTGYCGPRWMPVKLYQIVSKRGSHTVRDPWNMLMRYFLDSVWPWTPTLYCTRKAHQIQFIYELLLRNTGVDRGTLRPAHMNIKKKHITGPSACVCVCAYMLIPQTVYGLYI